MIRKLKLWNTDKTENIDLNEYATNWQGLGLEYDLAFKESNDNEYLDNMKVANKDIKANLTFSSYVSYDKFKNFILKNSLNPFVLEYSTPHIETTKEIILKDEDIEVEASDDEYFIHIPIISKYNLKQETIPFTETATYPEITRDKYAEVKLLEGKTEVINEQLVHVLNPLVQIQKDEEVTQAQFFTELKQWDTIKVINGDYKKEVGSGQITFDGSESWDYQLTNNNQIASFYLPTTYFNNYKIVDRLNLKSNFFTTAISGSQNLNLIDVISFSSNYSNIIIDIDKSKLIGYSDELAKTEKVNLFKQWLSQNNLQVVYQTAETTLEDVEMDGGLELIKDGNVNVWDDNGILDDTVTLQYKPWNWSKVVRKINLKKFTISGDDLIIYLKASEVDNLNGDTIEDKVKTYFTLNDSRATMLLREYIKEDNVRYRDVYVKSLTKGEKDNFNLLRSELTLRPIEGWYKIYQGELTGANSGIFITNYSNIEIPVNIEITTKNYENPIIIVENPLLMIYGEGKIIEIEVNYTITPADYDNPKTLLIDSKNKKLTLKYLDMIGKEIKENIYGHLNMEKNTFIYIPSSYTEGSFTAYLLKINLPDDDFTTAKITYRRYV